MPLRADHQFLSELINLTLGGKIMQIPSEFDFLSRVFARLGGSWEGIFHGSPEDIGLLKTIIKRAFKLGYLTEKQGWGA